MAGDKEMGFFDHLGELRIRLIRILAVLVAASAGCLAFTDRLLQLLLAPYGSPLMVIGPTEGVSVYLRVALTAGASVTLPYALLELWGFVRPGLHRSERRYVRVLLPCSIALFLSGASFAWFLLIPAAVRFLASFAPAVFRVQWTSERYVPFVTSLLFWIGVCFQMPLSAYFLSRLRIVSARLLLSAWRYAMVAIAAAAALITPTVDPFNMMLVAVPLAGLYFVSVLVAALAGNRRSATVRSMIPDKVRIVLDAHGLRAVEFEKGSTATSVLAAQKLGVAVGQIAKSLLFVGKDGRKFLLLAPGDRRVSSAKLKAACGVKVRMANPEETLSATGFAVGGVCPFGIDAGIAVLIDRSLSQYGTVYPAAGNDASGVPMSYAQLVAVTGGTEGDFLGDGDPLA